MYTAIFKLEQDDNGMVTPSVTFDPKVDPTADEAPAIYNYVAEIALDFLKQVELVDEEGNWASEEAMNAVGLNTSSKTLQ